MSPSSSPSSPFSYEQLPPPPPLQASVPGAFDDPVAAARSQAAREAEAIRARAFEDGRSEGLAAAREQVESALAALAEALSEADSDRERAAAKVEREAAELALALAEKIIGGALEVKPDLVLNVVEGTLRRLVDRERVIVLVSPDDFDLVSEAANSLSGSMGAVERLEVQAERRVQPGGCLLRTPTGEIDARVGSQLERAREVIAAEIGQ